MAFVATLKSWLRSRSDAERLARHLLRDVLSPRQRAQYDSKGFFDVTGGQTGTRYRIRTGSQMNVEELGGPLRTMCFVPKGGVPIGDILLAQKLALELMEEDTLKVAHPAHPAGRGFACIRRRTGGAANED
jgi:hypothetical protein